jgi:hypothetical protein
MTYTKFPTTGRVERRQIKYPGCAHYAARWIIATDSVPLPYRTEAEAHAELQRRQHDTTRSAA